MKILFITPVTIDSCSFYRTGGIAPDLSDKLGIDIDVTSWDKERFHWQTLRKYSLIMMQRPYTETSYTMGGYAKDLGIPVWIDYDDYLLGVPVDNRSHEVMTKSRELIEKVLSIADAVTVTTTVLKDELLKYNRNVLVIPNAHNDYIFRTREIQKKRQTIIGWRGSETHLADLMLMGEPMLKAFDNNPEWIFAFLGYNPAAAFYLIDLVKGRKSVQHKNVTYVPAQDPILYFKNIMKLAPAAFHVPLVDSLFNRSKSNIALIEASYSGSACIVPDWEEWRMPGSLVYKSGESYYNLIRSVIRGEIDVVKNAARAWEYITDNLMLSKVNNMRADLVKSLLK